MALRLLPHLAIFIIFAAIAIFSAQAIKVPV